MIVSLIMAFLCLSVFASNVWAAGFRIGIKAGDWVKYGYTMTGNFPYGDVSNVTWIKIEFTNVTNTATEEKVGILMIYHMQNGTETNMTSILDLQSESSGYYGLLIPANSSVGDTFSMGGTSVTIQNETTRTYAGASRTVLSASLTQFGTNSTNYWDKQTGVMVEATSIYSTYSANVAVTETNMWATGFLGLDWWWWMTIIVIIGGIIILAALIFRRRKSAPPAPSGQQAQQPPPPPPLPQ